MDNCLTNLYVYYNEQEDLLKFTHCCIDRQTTLIGTLSTKDFYSKSKSELYDYINSIVFTGSHECGLPDNKGLCCSQIWNNEVGTIVVAISRECNFHCPMCYVKGGHKDSPKRKQLYLDFIEKLSDYKFKSLKLTDWGEPLIYINEIIPITKKYKYCKSLSLVTNGSLLDKNTLDTLLNNYESLFIEFDCDSLDKPTYEKIRLGSDFNIFIKNLMNTIGTYNLNKDKLILILPCVEQNLNKLSINDIKQFAISNNINLELRQLSYISDIYNY